MRHRVLYIGRWTVDFFFADDSYDIKEVLSFLYDMGFSYNLILRCKDLMEANCLNTGFTCTDSEMMNAVVVIGPASSGKEFIDTLVHEIQHVAASIADNLGVDLHGEIPAYIAGDSARELADLVCSMGCDCCNPPASDSVRK